MKNMTRKKHKIFFNNIILWILTFLWAGVILGTTVQPGKESGAMSSYFSGGIYDVSVAVRDFLNGSAELPEFEGLGSAEIAAIRQVSVGNINGAVRNVAHAGSFFIMAVLLCASLVVTKQEWGLRKSVLVTLAFCVPFVLLNEFLQLFVPGRAAQLSDMGLDLVGAAFGLGVVGLWRRKRKV